MNPSFWPKFCGAAWMSGWKLSIGTQAPENQNQAQ